MLLLRGWVAGPDLEFVSTIPHFSLHFGLSAIFTNCNPLDTYLVFLNHVPLLWGSIKFLPKRLEQLSEPHSVAIWEGTWAVNRVEVIKKKISRDYRKPINSVLIQSDLSTLLVIASYKTGSQLRGECGMGGEGEVACGIHMHHLVTCSWSIMWNLQSKENWMRSCLESFPILRKY